MLKIDLNNLSWCTLEHPFSLSTLGFVQKWGHQKAKKHRFLPLPYLHHSPFSSPQPLQPTHSPATLSWQPTPSSPVPSSHTIQRHLYLKPLALLSDDFIFCYRLKIPEKFDFRKCGKLKLFTYSNWTFPNNSFKQLVLSFQARSRDFYSHRKFWSTIEIFPKLKLQLIENILINIWTSRKAIPLSPLIQKLPNKTSVYSEEYIASLLHESFR